MNNGSEEPDLCFCGRRFCREHAPRQKSPGQIAYEADVAARPVYHSGEMRKAWDDLGEFERETWERNPTPRWPQAEAA